MIRIEHIDAIARAKKRDVVFVEFHQLGKGKGRKNRHPYDALVLEWEHLSARRKVIEWLDAKAIRWSPCGNFADLDYVLSYRGQLYIDLPYDSELPVFQQLTAFLEKPDGSARIPGVKFLYCTLEQAMMNAFHDESGFWESWAESF